MNRVFVIQEKVRKDRSTGEMVPQFDFKPAQKFGTLQVLLSSAASLMAPVPTIRLLREKLRDFDDSDFLIAVGDPTAIAAACMVASDVNRGRVKLLKWDSKYNEYYATQIDVKGHEV